MARQRTRENRMSTPSHDRSGQADNSFYDLREYEMGTG